MRKHGKKGKALISIGAGAATAVLALTGWSLNAAGERADATAMGDANKQSLIGLPDINGALAGFYDNADTTLWKAAADSKNGIPVGLVLYPDISDPLLFAVGDAWIDVSINCRVSGAIEMAANWSAAGDWDLTAFEGV